MRTSSAVSNAKRSETRDKELARLIRDQRADRRQDRTGLKSTIAQEVLDAPDLCADLREAAEKLAKRYVPRARRPRAAGANTTPAR